MAQTELLRGEESVHLLIDGDQRPSSTDDSFVSKNPSTGEPLRTISAGSKEDIRAAVQSSISASQEWTSKDQEERVRLLQNVSDEILDRKEELAQLEAESNGKPISQSRAEAETTARFFEYYSGIADKVQGESIPRNDEYVNFTVREPLGVVGLIIPWNFPLQMFARTTSVALATGNTVVVKPAEHTSATGVALGEILLEAGIPNGVVNVVPGRGEEAGAGLAGHPDINGLSFTGSVKTGQIIGELAAKNITPVHLELGGKSPNVVYPDADTEVALDNAVQALFTAYTGQCCSAGSRLLVHQDIHDDFVERLANRVSNLQIGPATDDPDMGPMVSEEQFAKVKKYIEVGKKEVGEPIVGGDTLDRAGNFVEPTIFSDVNNSSRIAQEEVFGPVLTTMSFETEQEAIDLSNETDYGLASGIFTSDIGRAYRYAREVDAGQVYINEYFAEGVETPFGGYKNSGHGREKGVEAIKQYTQIKNICAKIE